MAFWGCASVDFFASLPPEMVLNILSHLDDEDAVHCLAVSKSWREVVGSRDGYWKKSCVQFGLPEDLIEEHILHKKCCASPVALFLAARRQRLYISGSGGMFARLEREAEVCPSAAPVAKKRRGEARESPTTSEKLWTTPCKTLSIGNRYILEVCFYQEHLIPNPLGAGGYSPPRMQVSLARLGRINGKAIENVCKVSEDVFDSSEAPEGVFDNKWRNLLPHHQCIVTMKTTSTHPQQWLKFPLAESSTRSQPLLLSSPFPQFDYSTPEPVEVCSGCSACSLMVTAASTPPIFAIELGDPSSHCNGTWDLCFIALDSSGELTHVQTEKVSLRASIQPYKVALIPGPNGGQPKNICDLHHLILQAGQSLGIYQLKTVPSPNLQLDLIPITQSTFFEFKAGDGLKFCLSFISRDILGEFVISFDRKLLGVLQGTYDGSPPATLHLWSLTSSDCTKVDEVEINQSHLVLHAVGHTYSILGTCYREVLNIMVVSTHRGETVWKCSSAIDNIEVYMPGFGYSLMHSTLEVLTVTKEEWLNDVHTASSPFIPFMTFTNFAEAVQGNLAIDGLSFRPSEYKCKLTWEEVNTEQN